MNKFNLEIHFPASQSKNYPEVMRHARLFSGFTEKPNVLKIIEIEEVFRRWEAFSIVLFGATKWTGTTVYFDGIPVLPYKNDFFYKLLDVKQCHSQYTKSTDKQSYCSGSDWGCYRLKVIGRYVCLPGFYISNPFYRYGHFNGAETWMIDKDRILENLAEEARIIFADKCLAFDLERIKMFVSKLPDQINLDENWETEYKLDIGKEGMTGIPVNINFVANPEPKPLPPEDEFRDPEEEGSDEHLDKLLREREKNRKDDYSDLL